MIAILCDLQKEVTLQAICMFEVDNFPKPFLITTAYNFENRKYSLDL